MVKWYAWSRRCGVATILVVGALLIGSHEQVSAWGGISHIYMGEEVMSERGRYCALPDLFHLASMDTFRWCHNTVSAVPSPEGTGTVDQSYRSAHPIFRIAFDKSDDYVGYQAASIAEANRAALGFAWHSIQDEVVHYELFRLEPLFHAADEIMCECIMLYERMLPETIPDPANPGSYLLVRPPADPTPEQRNDTTPMFPGCPWSPEQRNVWVRGGLAGYNVTPPIAVNLDPFDSNLIFLAMKVPRKNGEEPLTLLSPRGIDEARNGLELQLVARAIAFTWRDYYDAVDKFGTLDDPNSPVRMAADAAITNIVTNGARFMNEW